jgi:serine/threonine protein kinase
LGAGGGGAVYLAEDVALRQPRAVKVIHSEGLNDPADAVREATLMAAVRDPHVATIHAVERRPDQIWLVCEFMDGGTLADRLTNGPLLEEAVISIGLSIAGALGCLHAAGVVHGDVKPSNIGFDASATVKLFDFGLAQKAGAHSRLTAGTPAYLWPELLRGALPGPHADAWGLGVTLYEAATGVNPFKAPTAEAILDRVRAGWVEKRPRAGEIPIAIHLSDWLAGADHRLEALVAHIRRSNP